MSARRQASTTSLAKYARAHSPILQNRSLDFCNSFWGFGDGGVDVLFARMRGATRTMEELKNFWKERAVIEEDYAKRLAKLSKMTLGRDEIGDLRVSLDTVRSEIERQAGFHLNLSQQIRTELEVPTTAFHSRQLQHKKTYQTGIEKEFKTKQTQESYVNKAREKYEQDCVRINAFTAQATLVQGKDLEKINLKLERTQQTVQTNEREFANFAKALQDTVQKWETDWKGFCDSCQDMEEDRMEFMKDNIWTYANAVSTVCVADDESCEKIRLALEQMEPEKDMESFVRDYGTGNQIPDPPTFVNYQEPDAIPSSSARPTSRPASFARSTHRELPIRQQSLPPEEEPIINAAGIGAGGGGGGRRVDPYIQDTPGPSRSDTRNSQQVSQLPYTNGTNGYYPHPGAGSSPSSASAPLSQQQVHRQSTTSTQYSQQQQLQRVLQDPHADPIDPTAETYIKVGANAYKVDLTKDPQQQGPSNIRHSTSSPASPAKPVGGGVDPLMRQLEELQHAVSASGSVRRNTLIKPKPSTGPEPKPGHVSSMSASSRIETSSRPTSLSPPVAPGSATSNRRSPSPNRDYRNSAEAVVGVHPSVSRPPSPNPPTAAFMVPKPSTPSGPGADVVQEVLADYQQSLPGERKSISRSPSRGHAPSQSQASVPTHQSNQSQGQNLARPPSQVGHAGIGAFGSRSNSPQPLSRGPSPQPNASQQQQQQQQQARSNFIQPPAQAGPGLARAPSPNTVGIALDPSGRVMHDDMAQRYQQQQQHQQHQPPPQQVQQRPAPPPQTAQPTYQPPPPPAQAIQQQQQQARRASYVTQASTIAPPLAPQTYAVTPPPSNVYQTPSPQPQSYLPPQQVQPVYSAPPSQPLQYQPPSQQQARYLQQQQQVQQQQAQQQQMPPSPYGSVNGLQRGGSTISYYGNQTPPQQPQMQPQPQQMLQQPVQQQRLGQVQQQQPEQQRGYQQLQYRDPSPVRASPSPQPPPQTVDDGSTVLFYVKALYDYTATIEEEFDFQAGDIIAVTATPEDGWWSGELLDEARRQKGRNVFPSNFVCLF